MQKVHEIKEDISKYNQDFTRNYNDLNEMMRDKFNTFIAEIQNFTENFRLIFFFFQYPNFFLVKNRLNKHFQNWKRK